MSISFHCSCGVFLQAKATFAGRKMRCPSCGTVLPIPGGIRAAGEAGPTASPPERPAHPLVPAPAEAGNGAGEGGAVERVTPPDGPAVVRFVCDCGRVL